VLIIKPGASESLRDTTAGLLRHLSLLFVPAGAGVMVYASAIATEGLGVAATLLASTLITVVVTACAMRRLSQISVRRATAEPRRGRVRVTGGASRA
jgi:holin-like protein